jgi:hypothetical protein
MFRPIKTDAPEGFVVAPGVYNSPSQYGPRAIGTRDRDTSEISYSGGLVAAALGTDEATAIRDRWATREVRAHTDTDENIPYTDLATLWREQVAESEP